VTIDAMGCQTAIVEHIVEQKADYVVSLKGNQGRVRVKCCGKEVSASLP